METMVVSNGGHIDSSNGGAEGSLTTSVVVVCIIAASAGLMFGYDVGVSGGVTTMEPFLNKFFPSVLTKMAGAKQNVYCTFDSQDVTAFTSSLYLAGLVSSLLAGHVMTAAGRKGTLIISGIFFFIGSALNAFAANVAMLIFGRLFLGFGVGFANQAAPVYLSEMAPPKWRGALASGFEFFLNLGNVVATLVNYFAARLDDLSWRVSLGFAAVPALILTVGALCIPDTPSSLVQRGKLQQAQQSLAQVRGIDSDSEFELNHLISSSEAAKTARQVPYKLIFRRRYRPHLVLASATAVFQQLTGINLIAFYAPVIIRTFGSTREAALLAATILGVVNCCATLVSTCLVDRVGRRFLYLEGGAQTCVCQVAIACLLAVELGTSGTELPDNATRVMLILMCLIAAAFGWSWGPLTWIIPSEILPLEVRPAGQGICIALNFAITFVLAQISLTMLCHLKYGVFLFYAALVLAMTVFLALFLPETKGIRPGSMDAVWRKHWYWRRFVEDPAAI